MKPRRFLWVGSVLFGVTLIVLGLGVLTSWEIEALRATTLDRDFTGLVCGSPLNNPGWHTGTPCHGAVNRQTAFGLVILGLGATSIVANVAYLMMRNRK